MYRLIDEYIIEQPFTAGIIYWGIKGFSARELEATHYNPTHYVQIALR